MAEMQVVKATIRENYGSGNNRRLRRAGQVPAVIYGGEGEPLALTLDHNAIFHQLENESFFSSILEIDTGKDKIQAILREVQMHPVKTQVMHVDFLRIKRGQLLTMYVPLHVTGAEDAPGAKEGGIVSQMFNEIEISTLPRHLPEYLVVDVSKLEIGDSVHLSDIVTPEGVTILALAHDDSEDRAVASVLAPTVEKEPEEDEEAAEEEAADSEKDSDEEAEKA